MERFREGIKVIGTDGTLWDIVPGELEFTEDPVRPFVGNLYPDVGAAITGWSGPVQLILPDGRKFDAYITPAEKRGDLRAVRVHGI